MGQHKLDKMIKEKLSQREITPSENAWDRLDAMLTVSEEKKPKRNYGWLYVAATILGFLFIATVFFSQTEELIDKGKNEVVIENNTIEKTSEKNIQNDTEIPATKTESIAAVSEIKETQSNSKQNKSIINQNQSQSQAVAVNEIPKTESIANNNSNQNNANQTIITRAPANWQSNQKTVQQPQAKVDELLAAVVQNQKQDQQIKVNAKSLLSQVDGEVNTTFREKIIRKINKNYQEVAETVSNRNIQQ